MIIANFPCPIVMVHHLMNEQDLRQMCTLRSVRRKEFNTSSTMTYLKEFFVFSSRKSISFNNAASIVGNGRSLMGVAA